VPALIVAELGFATPEPWVVPPSPVEPAA